MAKASARVFACLACVFSAAFLPLVGSSVMPAARSGPSPASASGAPGASGVSSAVPSSTSHTEVSLYQICVLCCVMYGSIGLLWALHAQQHKQQVVASSYQGGRSSIRSEGSDHHDESERMVQFRTALLCVSWASTSVGMHVLNKTLAVKLQAPALISGAQMLFAVVFMVCTAYNRIMTAPRGQLLQWMIVPGLFASMLVSSIYSYEYISLSLLTVVRNLTPLVVLPIESLVMPPDKQPKVSGAAVVAILTMLAGAVIYAGGIDKISVLGVAFAVANLFLASTDRLVQRRLLTTECKDLHSTVCTTMNNAVGMLPTLGVAYFTNQISDLHTPEKRALWSDPAAWILLLLSGGVGIGICYLGFECQRLISATSFFVMQNVSKVAVVAAGVFVFHDPIHSPLSVFGLLLSLGGSFAYGKAQMSAPAPQQQPPAHDGTVHVRAPKKREATV